MNYQEKVNLLVNNLSHLFQPEEADYYKELYSANLAVDGVEEVAFKETVNVILQNAHIHIHNPDLTEIVPMPDEYLAAEPKEDVLGILYDDDMAVAEAIANNPTSSAVDFIYADLSNGDISNIADIALEVPRVDADIILPDAGLTVEGLDDDHLDYIISMYVASFSRAPDAEGLVYWGEEVVGLMEDDGLTFEESANIINESFYLAGTENGEAGTDVDTEGFVTGLYNNLLGREPDQAGLNYWVNEIDTGNVNRADFLTFFIDAAFEWEEDANHIERLVTTSEFLSQDNVSGEASNIDIGLLDSVTDIRSDADAAQMILNIVEDYGQPAAGDVDLSGLQASLDGTMIA